MSKNTEIWKSVQGYEGLYEVSNMGNVKSLGNDKTRKEKILKPGKNKAGYYKVDISKQGKSKTILVHVLVAQAFLGHIPDGTHNVVPDHKDRDKSNNRADNLELITQRENVERYWLTQKTSSKYIGVCWNKQNKKWQASITIDGKQKHLGYFTTELEAHLAYQNAVEEILNRI
jgi:hypothetical protein